jgi:hypothetical protein
MTIPNRNLNFPTAIKFGAGRIKELAEHCKALRVPCLSPTRDSLACRW